MAHEEQTSFVDQVVDDLMPEDFDWRSKVRAYPMSALTVAAVGGFLVGRSQGLSLLGSLSSYLVNEVSSGFSTILGEDSSET